MTLINNLGPETSPIWIILDEPYQNDSESGTILGGGYGYNFKKIWKLAGLSLNDVHIRPVRSLIGSTVPVETALSNLLHDIECYKPTIIVPLSDIVLNYLVPETTQ